jgi:hypothetical protein
VNVKPSEFKTFVIHIGLIDLAPYYSEPVLSRSGYAETSAIGWISLRELVSLVRKERDHINTPNGEQPWDIFLKGIRPELARDGSVEALFDYSTK